MEKLIYNQYQRHIIIKYNVNNNTKDLAFYEQSYINKVLFNYNLKKFQKAFVKELKIWVQKKHPQ